ncbi:MAG: hypothetical protein KIT76_09330 [Pseudolabrys sp.]|nr:hypothetical protein [Pseudolabrys sp.]
MDDRALPAIARCAMQPTWADAHKLLVCLAADAGATLPPAGVAAGLAGSAAKAGEAGVWAMKRAMARSVADALAAAGHEPLGQAWWLLSLDPKSKTDMSEGSSAIVLATAVCSDTLLAETARAWQALANAASPDAHPDPIAAAHRLRSQERAQSTPSQAGILDGLPFLVAAQPSYEKATRVALFAANEMLDAIEYAGTLRGAFAEGRRPPRNRSPSPRTGHRLGMAHERSLRVAHREAHPRTRRGRPLRRGASSCGRATLEHGRN